MLGVREVGNNQIAAMLILVPPSSSACRFAKEDEAEIHLLGVKPVYRRQGLGRALVQKAINQSKLSSYTKLILWTRHIMKPAQSLYEEFGFTHVGNFVSNGHDFRLYELALSTQ